MTLFDVSPPLSRRSDPSTSHAKAGYLVDSGERRPSDRGRLMVVWVRV